MTGRFVNDKIVDHILIHSRDRNLFSLNNKGMEGIMKIMESHVCSIICQELDMSLSNNSRSRSSSSSSSSGVKDEKQHRLDQHTDLFSPISSNQSPPNLPVDSKIQQKEQNRQAIVKKFRDLCISLQQTQPLLTGLKPLVTPSTYLEQPVDFPPGIELIYNQGNGSWEFYDHYTKTNSTIDPRGGGATYPPKPITSGLKNFFSKIISPIGQTISSNLQNVLPQSPPHSPNPVNPNGNVNNNANNNNNVNNNNSSLTSSPTSNNNNNNSLAANKTSIQSPTTNKDEIRTSNDGFELPTYDK